MQFGQVKYILWAKTNDDTNTTHNYKYTSIIFNNGNYSTGINYTRTINIVFGKPL